VGGLVKIIFIDPSHMSVSLFYFKNFVVKSSRSVPSACKSETA